MYGISYESELRRINAIPLEQLREIKLSPKTATVEAEHNSSWVGESKEQLVMDEQGWGKKWITERVMESTVEILFNQKNLIVSGIGFVSANDCPHRDVKSITIYWWNAAEDTWIESLVARPNWEEKRHHLLKFKIEACRTQKMKFFFSHEGKSE